jgi:hypothetical protein
MAIIRRFRNATCVSAVARESHGQLIPQQDLKVDRGWISQCTIPLLAAALSSYVPSGVQSPRLDFQSCNLKFLSIRLPQHGIA